MGLIIEDGTGKGNHLSVDSSNRARTLGDVRPLISNQAIEGLSYSFPTNILTLTSGTTHKGLAFVKNTNSSKNLFIDSIQISCSGGAVFRILRNPTSVSAAFTSGAGVNTNFSSEKSFVGSFSIGSDTGSFAGGQHFAQLFVQNRKQENVADGAIILSPGNALGVTAQANASINVGVTLFGYLE